MKDRNDGTAMDDHCRDMWAGLHRLGRCPVAILRKGKVFTALSTYGKVGHGITREICLSRMLRPAFNGKGVIGESIELELNLRGFQTRCWNVGNLGVPIEIIMIERYKGVSAKIGSAEIPWILGVNWRSFSNDTIEVATTPSEAIFAKYPPSHVNFYIAGKPASAQDIDMHDPLIGDSL